MFIAKCLIFAALLIPDSNEKKKNRNEIGTTIIGWAIEENPNKVYPIIELQTNPTNGATIDRKKYEHSIAEMYVQPMDGEANNPNSRREKTQKRFNLHSPLAIQGRCHIDFRIWI